MENVTTNEDEELDDTSVAILDLLLTKQREHAEALKKALESGNVEAIGAGIQRLQRSSERTMDEANAFIKSQGLKLDIVTVRRYTQKEAEKVAGPTLPGTDSTPETTPKKSGKKNGPAAPNAPEPATE